MSLLYHQCDPHEEVRAQGIFKVKLLISLTKFLHTHTNASCIINAHIKLQCDTVGFALWEKRNQNPLANVSTDVNASTGCRVISYNGLFTCCDIYSIITVHLLQIISFLLLMRKITSVPRHRTPKRKELLSRHPSHPHVNNNPENLTVRAG